jgi:hypothetical protein
MANACNVALTSSELFASAAAFHAWASKASNEPGERHIANETHFAHNVWASVRSYPSS